MLKNTTVQLLALGLVGSFVATAAAQDSGALIDALVRKGVLKDQEAESIRSQLTRDYAASSSAGKLNLNSSIKELKLSGDVRVRGQYDTQDSQSGATGSANVTQRDRYRLRLRVGADYKLADNWFAGFGLQTTQNNDSGNQTMGDGTYHQNYNIYINKAFIGWNCPTNGLTLIAGKQANPFYTTDLVWDADINPAGFTQRVDFHKMFELGGLELSLVAGQFVVSDNAESAATSATNRDAFTYQLQLIGAANVFDGVKLTVAPGFYFSNGASLNSTGVGAPATVGGGEGNPAIANATDGLKIILAPGDVAFKVAGMPAKVLWDFAYNTDANDRTELYSKAISKSGTDKLAYLFGFQLGENKKKGDWSLSANYRRVGLSAVDPNINDSDWALSATNQTGYRASFAYNLGDSTTLGATYYVSDNLRKNINGYTGNPAGANSNSVQILQLDLGVKF